MKKARKAPEFKQNLNYVPKTEKYKSLIESIQTTIKKKSRMEALIYWAIVCVDIIFVVLMAIYYNTTMAILLGIVFLIIPVFVSYMIEQQILKKYSDLLDLINLDDIDINNNVYMD